MRIVRYFIFALLFVFASCGNNNGLTERVITTFDNGQPAKVRLYDKDNQCVHEVHYYDNGALYMEGDKKGDLREGEWVSYFLDGKVQSTGYFENDLRTGRSLVYYENGNLWMEGYYKEGKQVGLWIYYDEQGYETFRIDRGE